MANGVKRFQSHGGQFRPIVREVGQEELTARAELGVHTRFTQSRRAPQAPQNRFVGVPLAGSRVGGQQGIRGGVSNPIRNDKFV